MTLSLLMLTLAAYTGPVDNTNEGQVQACIQGCLAYADTPNYDLKACVTKCQELSKP